MTIIALAVCAALAGCSTATPAAPSSLPQENVSEWVMPLDQFIPTNTHDADYAENLLVEPCMNSAGYSWNVPWQQLDTAAVPTMNAVQRTLFNTAIAARYGYHSAQTPDQSTTAWRAFQSAEASLPNAEETTLTSCVLKARKTLPRLPGSAQLASNLAESAYTASLQDPTVTTAESKWRSCMADAGISDLPTGPAQMPTSSMADEFELDTTLTPTHAEIALAEKDARCRVTSGYVHAAYTAEWDRQATLEAQNADSLKGVASQVAKNKAAVLKIIELHAPTDPYSSNG